MDLSRNGMAFIVIALAGFVASCDQGPTRTMIETRTVALQGAERVEVGLDMGAGELQLRAADQEPLLEAAFEFNRERLRPEVDYRRFGERGILRVRESSRRRIRLGTTRNRWDLRLSGAVPIDLDINLGAGKSRLDLVGLKLRRVDIDMGVGEMELDLRGRHEEGFRVKIDGGVGSGRIELPTEAGVRVKVDGGIGSVNAQGLIKQGDAYVNDAYGRSQVSIEVDINAGIGSIDLLCGTSSRIKT